MVIPLLFATVSRQGGAFTTAQALAAGYTESEIRTLVRAREWVRLRRGVYAERCLVDELSPSDSHKLGMRALILRCGNSLVASHETAAVIQALELLRPDLSQLHVTRADLGAARCEAGVNHHRAALPEDQIGETAGFRHTTQARTAVDLARTGTFEQGVAACDSALRSGATAEELRAVMEMCATWPGAREASRAVAFADSRAANPGESWSRVVLARIGLPAPELQVEVRDEQGLVGIVDFMLEAQRTIGEFDGMLKYRVEEGVPPAQAGLVLQREKTREDRLRRLGYEVVRWVWADLYQPHVLTQRFDAAFARARGVA